MQYTTIVPLVFALILVLFIVFIVGHIIYTYRKDTAARARRMASLFRSGPILPVHRDAESIKLTRVRTSTSAPSSRWQRLITSIRVAATFQRVLADIRFFRGYQTTLELLEAGDLRAIVAMPSSSSSPSLPSPPPPAHIKHESATSAQEQAGEPKSLPVPVPGLAPPPKVLASKALEEAVRSYQSPRGGSQAARSCLPDIAEKPAVTLNSAIVPASPLSKATTFSKDAPVEEKARAKAKVHEKRSRRVTHKLSSFIRLACISAPHLQASIPSRVLSADTDAKPRTIFTTPDFPTYNAPAPRKGFFDSRKRTQHAASYKWPPSAARAVRRSLLKPHNTKSVVATVPQIFVTSATCKSCLSLLVEDFDDEHDDIHEGILDLLDDFPLPPPIALPIPVNDTPFPARVYTFAPISCLTMPCIDDFDHEDADDDNEVYHETPALSVTSEHISTATTPYNVVPHRNTISPSGFMIQRLDATVFLPTALSSIYTFISAGLAFVQILVAPYTARTIAFPIVLVFLAYAVTLPWSLLRIPCLNASVCFRF